MALHGIVDNMPPLLHQDDIFSLLDFLSSLHLTFEANLSLESPVWQDIHRVVHQGLERHGIRLHPSQDGLPPHQPLREGESFPVPNIATYGLLPFLIVHASRPGKGAQRSRLAAITAVDDQIVYSYFTRPTGSNRKFHEFFSHPKESGKVLILLGTYIFKYNFTQPLIQPVTSL